MHILQSVIASVKGGCFVGCSLWSLSVKKSDCFVNVKVTSKSYTFRFHRFTTTVSVHSFRFIGISSWNTKSSIDLCLLFRTEILLILLSCLGLEIVKNYEKPNCKIILNISGSLVHSPDESLSKLMNEPESETVSEEVVQVVQRGACTQGSVQVASLQNVAIGTNFPSLLCHHIWHLF